MTRAAVSSKQTISRNLTGTNLASVSFTTLSTGSGNGRYWTHSQGDVVLLKNDTGGPATFTVVFTAPAQYTQFGMTIASPTIVVADGKTVAVRLGELLQDTSGQILLDCDVAGKVAILNCLG